MDGRVLRVSRCRHDADEHGVRSVAGAPGFASRGRRGTQGRRPRRAPPDVARSTCATTFVAMQVAAAFILLAGAGLLIRSFQRVMDVDTGYNTEGIVAAYLPLPMERESGSRRADPVHPADPRRGARRARGARRRGRNRHPAARLGRRHAVPPAREAGRDRRHRVQDRHAAAIFRRLACASSPAACSTIATPPVRCRSSSSTNRSSGATSRTRTRSASESWSSGFFRRDAGSDRRSPGRSSASSPTRKVSGLEAASDVGAYASFAQNPVVGLGLVARGSGDAGALIKSMQRAVSRVNKTQVLDRPTTVAQLKADSMSAAACRRCS